MLPEDVNVRLQNRIKEYKVMEKSHIPMLITISFATPMIFSQHPIYLDAVLGNIVAQEIWGEYYGKVPNDMYIEEIPLPLKKHNLKEYGYCWASSCGIVKDEPILNISGFKGGFHGDLFLKLEAFTPSQLSSINAGSGKYKSDIFSWEENTIKSMNFYIVGNRKEIERLLNQVKYISKKRSQGRGRVQGYKIKEVKTDNTLWFNNRPMRPIPLPLVKSNKKNEQYCIGMERLTPPYWDWRPETRQLCVVPDREMWTGINKLNYKKQNVINKSVDPYQDYEEIDD